MQIEWNFVCAVDVSALLRRIAASPHKGGKSVCNDFQRIATFMR